MDFLCGWFFVAFFCAAIGAAFAREKGRTIDGVLLGFLLGPLGILCCFFLERRYSRKCPYCYGGIPRKASRCRHCAADLDG